jgi:hypothetical protein
MDGVTDHERPIQGNRTGAAVAEPPLADTVAGTPDAAGE